MNHRTSLPLVVGCSLIAALLITVMVQGGWEVWIPILTALAVVLGILRRSNT